MGTIIPIPDTSALQAFVNILFISDKSDPIIHDLSVKVDRRNLENLLSNRDKSAAERIGFYFYDAKGSDRMNYSPLYYFNGAIYSADEAREYSKNSEIYTLDDAKEVLVYKKYSYVHRYGYQKLDLEKEKLSLTNSILKYFNHPREKLLAEV